MTTLKPYKNERGATSSRAAFLLVQTVLFIGIAYFTGIMVRNNRLQKQENSTQIPSPDFEKDSTNNSNQEPDASSSNDLYASEREGIEFDVMGFPKTMILGTVVQTDISKKQITIRTKKEQKLVLQIVDSTLTGKNIIKENPQPGVLREETSEPVEENILYTLSPGTGLKVVYRSDNSGQSIADEIVIL